MKRGFLFALCLLALWSMLLAGCAARRPVRMAGPVKVDGFEEEFRAGEIVDLRAGTAVTFTQMLDVLRGKELVFIGEVHNSAEHHLIQVQILQKLLEYRPNPVVAMEFFQVDQQGVLDAFIRGDMGEDRFLQEVEWDTQWGFPYRYYRPLVNLVREKQGRILAVNAPREIVRKVARSGLDALDPGERARIAREIDLEDAEHRAYVSAVFPLHAGHGTLEDVEHFYQAQCVWEDTMAENIAAFLERNPGRKLAVLAGNGHLKYGFGVPDRTVRRRPAEKAVVLPYTFEPNSLLKRDLADFLWLTP